MSRSNKIKIVQPIGLSVLFTFCFPLLHVHSAEINPPLRVIVKKGETLSSIVNREIGSSDPNLWKLVADFNNRTMQQTLEIGDVINLPADLFKPQIVVFEEQKAGQLAGQDEVTIDEDANDDQFITEPESSRKNECDDQEVCFEENVSEQTEKPDSVVDTMALENDKSKSLDISGPANPLRSTGWRETIESADSAVTIEQSVQAPLSSDSRYDVPDTVPVDKVDNKSEPEPEDQSATLAGPTQPEQSGSEQSEAEPIPARPGLFEVDEDAAVRALERSLIQLNALLLRPGRAEVTLSVDSSFDVDSDPVLVSIEDTTTNTTVQQVGQLESQVQNRTVALDLKFGLPYDSQVNLSLPFSIIDREDGVVVPGAQADNQDSSIDGFGDFAISFDKTLAVESGLRPDIIVSAAYNSDSGTVDIGSGANEFSLGFRATKRQDPLVFTTSIIQTITQESDAGFKAGKVTQFSIGTLLAASPYTSLQFLFTQALVASAGLDGQTIPNSDANIASFAAGVSSVLGRDLFLNAQLSMGLVERASDYRLSFSIARQFSY